MAKKYHVELAAAERQRLQAILSGGQHASRTIRRVQILLKSDQGLSYSEIAEDLEVSIPTIERVRKRYVEEGLEKLLSHRWSRSSAPLKMDGEKEAYLIALACTEAPEGRACWTVRLLADKFVELGYIDGVSYETVRRVLKKRNQTLAASDVVHSAARQRRIRLSHGRRVGGVPASVRRPTPLGLHG